MEHDTDLGSEIWWKWEGELTTLLRLVGRVGNQFGDMRFPVGRLHGVEKGMISVMNTVQYSSDERVGQGQNKMVKASPPEQVISWLSLKDRKKPAI